MPWSEWVPFEIRSVAGNVVQNDPGMYEIRLESEIQRAQALM